MRRSMKLSMALFTTALCLAAPAAQKQTVCTITVNSADEKESFRRHLPESRYRFVELVERDRPDWLASACRADVSCDVLVVSGHYDGYSEFFSDQLDVREYLPIAELERVACSDSCPGLFSRLKEVYLFGCNTLNPQPQSSASAEIVRSLVLEARPRKETERRLQALNVVHGQSSRDRMRQVFSGVPVIYGFSSAAPLGPVAGSTLDRYFRTHGALEIGRGHPSGRLLGHFAPYAMSVTQGTTENDALAGARRDMCGFADERLPDVARLAFVHELLQRPTAHARLYIDRIQGLMASLDGPARRSPALARALEAITGDAAARTRFLGAAREAEPLDMRVRMFDLARVLGWLTAEAQTQELVRMLGELPARATVGAAEVDLACTVNRQRNLDGSFERIVPPGDAVDGLARAAMRACLGSNEDRTRTLQGLLSSDDTEVGIAQVYLRHRPITEPTELRRLAAGIAGMETSAAQVRALEVLGRHYLSDREVLERLTRLFTETPSWSVQVAVAGALLRADLRAISAPALRRSLGDSRLPSPPDENMIDALLRRLQSP